MSSSIQLNDSQRNALLAGFSYIDRLLSEAWVSLSNGSDQGAIFRTVVPDSTATQRKVIADQVNRLRQATLAMMDACRIALPPPTISAIWGFRSTLMAADIALEEIGPSYLRGYGPIDEKTASGLTAMRAQIRTVVAEMEAYLAAGFGGDLSARLGRLDRTTDEVRLLREIERVVSVHGLVEFRQSLAHLLERLERNLWTVAFVGRVSCGKSSLLNFLLSTDVLPSGVTPVTAVPIRIVAGSGPSATVSFAGAKPERIPAGRLGEYASEDSNPGNVREVTELLLELPAPRLAADVCLVDTPGLGSLATAGAAQTLAFLPRCDIGVLMIDAGAALGENDVAVARSLLEGGAEVVAVLSKADLLVSADLGKLLSYVSHTLAEALGVEIEVSPVSVASGGEGMSEVWWNSVLAPRQLRHRELAAKVLRRKIGALRDAVVGVLSVRTGRKLQQEKAAEAHGRIGECRAAIEAARRRAYDVAFQEMAPANSILDAIAAEIAGVSSPDDLPERLAQAMGQVAAQFAGNFDVLLDEVRTRAEKPLVAWLAMTPSEMPTPSSRPLFDPAPVLAAGAVPRSWQRWPTLVGKRAALRRQLHACYASALDSALRQYGRALVAWAQRYLDELAVQFNAEAGPIEAVIRPSSPAGASPLSPEVNHDLELLRDWEAPTVA